MCCERALELYYLGYAMAKPHLTLITQTQWEGWFAGTKTLLPGMRLRLAEQSAKQPSLTYAQTLERALCYGGIDNQKQAENEEYWFQRFIRPSLKSNWSKLNKEKTEALIVDGRMHPRGMR
jgi:uncharacterized protein YdeI (YjbR/CyaY-like superfamily)